MREGRRTGGGYSAGRRKRTSGTVNARGGLFRGLILDAHSDEPIPFASMRLLKAGTGRLSDSAGGFSFHFADWPATPW